MYYPRTQQALNSLSGFRRLAVFGAVHLARNNLTEKLNILIWGYIIGRRIFGWKKGLAAKSVAINRFGAVAVNLKQERWRWGRDSICFFLEAILDNFVRDCHSVARYHQSNQIKSIPPSPSQPFQPPFLTWGSPFIPCISEHRIFTHPAIILPINNQI